MERLKNAKIILLNLTAHFFVVLFPVKEISLSYLLLSLQNSFKGCLTEIAWTKEKINKQRAEKPQTLTFFLIRNKKVKRPPSRNWRNPRRTSFGQIWPMCFPSNSATTIAVLWQNKVFKRCPASCFFLNPGTVLLIFEILSNVIAVAFKYIYTYTYSRLYNNLVPCR